MLLQALFLQLLWTPNHIVIGDTPSYLSFTISIFLALLAAIGFMLLWPLGWLLAMVVQGICLLTALFIRFTNPSYLTAAHLTLLYSICVVLYLNALVTRSAFVPQSLYQRRLEEDDDDQS